MQFNASRRGAIIASLMQYLSSFRRLVSAKRAVDKSLPPHQGSHLLVPSNSSLIPATRYVEAISPGRNYIPQIVILSGTALRQHSHYFPQLHPLLPRSGASYPFHNFPFWATPFNQVGANLPTPFWTASFYLAWHVSASEYRFLFTVAKVKSYLWANWMTIFGKIKCNIDFNIYCYLFCISHMKSWWHQIVEKVNINQLVK